MIEHYVISGSGRVGIHLLTSIIDSAGVSAISTHDPAHSTGNDSTTALIMADRRDTFAVVMSNLLVWRSNQPTEYKKTIEPYTESEQQFRLLYRFHKEYLPKHDLTRPYGLIEKFYYEDFVNDHNHVLNRLGLTAVKSITTVPAPYNYRDIILNHQELRQVYENLEQQ
jgi:hypothetical protein